MKTTDLVQLLRELAHCIEERWLMGSTEMIARARQAADEIEGRKTPPQIPVPPAWLVESWRQGWRPADDSLGGFGTYMARESAAWGYQQGITQAEAQAQTAGEIEGRRAPTDQELFSLIEFELIHDYDETSIAYEKLMNSAVTAARAVLARFGGGEGQHG